MTQDDRMETITDPAEIRATSDERGCCDCRTFDQHERECILPDERTTPAPVGAAVALDLDALHETICDNFTGMAEVRQAADLLVAEVRRLRQDIDECWVPLYHDTKHERDQATARAEAAEAEVGTLRDTLARRTDSHTQLVRENETLRAKVAAVEAEKEAILGQVDQAARLLRLNGKQADAQTVIAQVRRWPEFVDRAALATTGEGQ